MTNMPPNYGLRKQCIVNNLRLIASCIEAVNEPSQLKQAAFGLEDAVQLLKMLIYQAQKDLIDRAARDIDSKEDIFYG